MRANSDDESEKYKHKKRERESVYKSDNIGCVLLSMHELNP